jgi:retron-type reverse transcriptase
MTDDPKKRLYARIVRVSPQVLIARMRLHGFWPTWQGLPAPPPAEVTERTAIEKELASLRAEPGGKGSRADLEAALRDERKRRWEESKQRRAEKKKLRDARAAEKRAAWAQAKRGLVTYAGEGVSHGLAGLLGDEAALVARGLPVLHTPAELAAALGIPMGRLRWLTFHRGGAALVHYHRYGIPKKSGGMRAISAPKPALATAQQWVLANVLSKLAVEPQAHGFVPGRSIVSNATPHVGQRVVVNLDLKDFFPMLTFARVKGLFASFGYGSAVATCLALLCTEPPRVALEMDGRSLYVALGARVLPQGACTSPAITNLACRRLDRRLSGLGRRYGFEYTRYADDLTFSRDQGDGVGGLLRAVRTILEDEGLVEHPAKTHVMRRGRRQEVTGVTVNTKAGVARDEVRRLRAMLHNAAKHGLDSQNRDAHPSFAAYLRGRVAFVTMVDPSKKAQLEAALSRALAKG